MVHKFKMNGLNIAVDVNSGSVHVLDDAAYDILELYPETDIEDAVAVLSKKYPIEEVRECFNEIEALKTAGLLFAEDNSKAVANESKEQIVKALCLHVAHDCNLKCSYCFAGEGEYHGGRMLMPFETAKAAVDFLIANSGSRKNLEIDFFGGEPLLNFVVVKQTVEYARSLEPVHDKLFKFTITTNGLLLDDSITAYLNEQMDNAVLSLDGRREVNDAMRKTVNGRGSYDLVTPKFLRFMELRGDKSFYVRGTFTRGNLDFAKDVLHLAELGFKHVSVEPAIPPTAEAQPFSLTDDDIASLSKEYEKLAVHMLELDQQGRGFDFFHFNIDLAGGPCLKKRVTGCGAGTEYMAVAPDGRLFPCHQFVGLKDFMLGDVFGGITAPAVRDDFAAQTVFTKESCTRCWAKYYCGGGCAANAYLQNGDIGRPYELGCKMHRKRCECAIMMKAAKAR